ncbi:MAG: hypothetical protein H3C34_18605 [Caldilineaceae bacterium]|nr:hypothetical protein [Caldilineaceae bacterium]
MSHTTTQSGLSRRQFLRWGALGSGAVFLAACAAAPAATLPPATPTAEPTPVPAAAAETAAEEVTVMVRDVLEYSLTPQGWEGPYGSVTFRLHQVWHNGEAVYHIRTDASDPAFAEEVGLVYVPLLNVALTIENVNKLYRFEGDRMPVISMIPGDENYSSLFRIVDVAVSDSSLELLSEADIEQAVQDGGATLAETNLFVNYPLIQWTGGGLTVDPELKEVLPGGQLFAPPDLEAMTVTMKLHQCYPGSRYILTDTSAVPMAPMMNIPASAPTQQLKEKGGTDEIWVFGNGISGPGVMGFQPAIFDNKAGEPAWSPFWDHFTVVWNDESNVRVLTNSAEIRELVASGELQQFNGVPDSHPNGFVVNCPAPILAPNTFQA